MQSIGNGVKLINSWDSESDYEMLVSVMLPLPRIARNGPILHEYTVRAEGNTLMQLISSAVRMAELVRDFWSSGLEIPTAMNTTNPFQLKNHSD